MSLKRGSKTLPAPDYREALRSAVADKTLTQEQATQLGNNYADAIRLEEADALRRVMNRQDFKASYADKAAKIAQPFETETVTDPVTGQTVTRPTKAALTEDNSVQQAAREWLKKDPTLLGAAVDNAKRFATSALATLPGNSEIAVVGRLIGSDSMEKFGLENLKYLNESGDQRRDDAFTAHLAGGAGSIAGFMGGSLAIGGPALKVAVQSVKGLRAGGG